VGGIAFLWSDGHITRHLWKHVNIGC
jgi:hypothetical protein